MGFAGRLVALASLAACTPAVSSGNVVPIDDTGMPITEFLVPLSATGQIRSLDLLISNAGISTSSPIALALQGDAAADFQIKAGCTGRTLDPGMACTVTLQFQSQTVGKRMADLVITADGTSMLELVTDVFKPAP